jgi:uncharacterized RDD family membrane protein YckC
MNLLMVAAYYMETGHAVGGLVSITYFSIEKQWILLALLTLLFLIYSCLIPYLWNGQTPAKKLLKIRIVSTHKLSLSQLILRNLVGVVLIEGSFSPLSNYMRNVALFYLDRNFIQYAVYFSMIVSLISIGLMFFGKKQKMLHDYLSKTCVIKAESLQ